MKKIKKRLPTPVTILLLYTSAVLVTILSLKYMTFLAAPLLFSFVIAYLFNPVVNALEKKTGLSRGLIAGSLMLLLVLILVILMANLIPYAVDQISTAAENLPQLLADFTAQVKEFSKYISKNFADYVGNIDLMVRIKGMVYRILYNFSNLLFDLFSRLYTLILMVFYLVITPLFAFYFLKDYRKIKGAILGLVPERLQERVIKKMKKMNQLLHSFIRGQAIVVLILAILYSIGLTLIGMPFSILIGIGAGLGDIIPYMGTVVGLIVSLVIGLAHFQSAEKLLLVLLVFAVVKGSENWYFYPKIVGKEVGLHFVWVLLSIIVFGNIFGFWGLLVAIPASAGFKMFFSDVIKYYKKTEFFNRS